MTMPNSHPQSQRSEPITRSITRRVTLQLVRIFATRSRPWGSPRSTRRLALPSRARASTPL